jgi:ribonuclease D
MRVVGHDGQLAALVQQALGADRLALDLEASGMFAYRARLCTVQLAWGGGETAIVDALRVPARVMAGLLGEHGPVKIVHDVAFDARVLAEEGVELGNVHDTALAARMLGRTATGLASLAKSELGVELEKSMQHHDWRLRPIDDAMLAYLAADVLHLEPLEQKLWSEVLERSIEAEVLEETRYRLACAIRAVSAPVDDPPYVRVKGVDRLAERERAALRVLAELREREAERRDVPPYRVASAEALVVMARTRPKSRGEIARIRGMDASASASPFLDDLARALRAAPEVLPDEERARFDRPRPPPEVLKLRREREARLAAWRKAEAHRRGVDEQVVLPGHCLQDAVDLASPSTEELSRIPGMGALRVERDGAAMVAALRGEGAPADTGTLGP